MADPFQLGVPGAMPMVPSSGEDAESPAKKSRSAPSANKAGVRERRDERVGKDKTKASKSLTLDMETLEHLLDQQCSKILAANREHAQGLLDALEERQTARFLAIERTVEGVEYTVEGFEARLKAVEEKLAQGRGLGDDPRCRWTLVFGGWDRDTRKQIILAELDQAVLRLGIKDSFDEAPYTTGPRRAIALANIAERPGEPESDRRARMHGIVAAFSRSQMLTTAKKKLWAGVSKTKAERDIAGHCAWLRRSLGSISAELVGQLDCEYGTGTSWMGVSLLASVSRAIPTGTDASDIIVNDKDGVKGWIDVRLVAKETKLDEKTVRAALQAHQR